MTNSLTDDQVRELFNDHVKTLTAVALAPTSIGDLAKASVLGESVMHRYISHGATLLDELLALRKLRGATSEWKKIDEAVLEPFTWHLVLWRGKPRIAYWDGCEWYCALTGKMLVKIDDTLPCCPQLMCEIPPLPPEEEPTQ